MCNPRSRGGFVVITIALSMFFLMGFAGLAIDVGFFRYVKRLAQNAADAGAVGAAMAMANAESAETSGRVDAAKNGFPHGQDNITVDVNNPPSMGAFAGKAGYVEVIVTQPRSTFFMNALNIDCLVLMLFFFLLIGIIECGRVLNSYHFLSNASREAVRYAMVRGADSYGAGASAKPTSPTAPGRACSS